jgi:hypothetical protein
MFVIIATWLVVYLISCWIFNLFQVWCLAKSLDMGDVVLQKKQDMPGQPGPWCFFTNWLHQKHIIHHNMTEWSSESSAWENGWKLCVVFSPSRLFHSYLVRWALSLAHTRGREGGRKSQPSIPSIGGGANDPWVLM